MKRKNIKVALLQMIPEWNFDPISCKKNAMTCVEDMIKEAKNKGADFACLPEMWCCPYSTYAFEPFEEERGGELYSFLSRMAEENKLYLIGGTFPERDGEALYNTCFVFDPDGKEIACHRKVHLFGIHVPGRKPFDENDSFLPGEGPTVFDTEFGKIGIAVCFDLRFPELLIEESFRGAEIIFAPSSFGMLTGPAHWRDLIRMRAIDTQTFFCGINNSFHDGAKYLAYGHSCAYDPWGECIAEAGSGDEVLCFNVDLSRNSEVREMLPIMKSREREAAKKRIG